MDKLREKIKGMKFYNPGMTRWLSLSDNEVNQILSLVKKEIWEKAIRTEHDDMMMEWLDDLLSKLQKEHE